jgi:uncharacterized protein (DUF488 family)
MHLNIAKGMPAPEPVTLHSIGHSDHCVETFLALLHQHHITTVVDVRSQPYSQWTPQFNRESFARDLQSAQLRYVFMGDALGGRPTDRSFYDPGEERPNYDRLKESPAFLVGIDQLLKLARREAVAFMCSEGDYHKCHRALLITPALLRRDVRVFHIQPDGSEVEAQLEFEQTSLL